MKTIKHNFQKSVSILVLAAALMSTSIVNAIDVTFVSWTAYSSLNPTATGIANTSQYKAIIDTALVTKVTVAHATTKVSSTDITNLKNHFPNLATLDLSEVQYTSTTFPQSFGTGTGNTTLDANTVKLQIIKLPLNITSIAGQCFKNCPELTTVVLPVGVNTLSQYAFYNCPKLTTINLNNTAISSTYTTGGNIFGACTGLTTIALPDSLHRIPSSMFNGCTSLKRLTLPKADSIYINSNAFANCTVLSEIICNSTKVTGFSGTAALLPNSGAYGNCKLYVPSATVAGYQSSVDAILAKFKDANILALEGLTAVNNVSFDSTPVLLYPNPTSDNFSVKNADGIQRIEIISMSGQLLKTFNQQLLSYSVDGLNAGIYFVRIVSASGSEVCKIVVE